jgi:predicted DNA-binding WGR domain protein
VIHLTRTDPARNTRRFYTVHLQPTLFGATDVVREWGREDCAGTVHTAPYATESEARAALAKAISTKLKRGYQLAPGP